MAFKFVPKQNMTPDETLNKISETLDDLNQTIHQHQTQSFTSTQIDWDKIQKSLENISNKLDKIVNTSLLNKQLNNNNKTPQNVSEQIVKERKDTMFRDKLMKSLNTIGNILGSILKSFKPIQIIVNLFGSFFKVFNKLFNFLDKFIFKSKWFTWMFKTGHILLGWLYKYILLSIFKGFLSLGKFIAKPFTWLGKLITPLLGWLVKPLGQLFTPLLGKVLIKPLEWLFKPLVGLLKPVQSWIVKPFKKAGSTIGGWFGNLFKRKKKTVVETVGNMVGGQQTGKAQVETQKQGGFGQGLGMVFQSLQSGLTMLGTPQQLLGQATVVVFQIQLRILRPILETLIGKISEVVIEIVRSITELTKSGYNTLIETLKIQSDLQKKGPQTANNFKIIAGGITQLQTQFSEFFLSLGTSNVLNAISGFMNVINPAFWFKETRKVLQQNTPQVLIGKFFNEIIFPIGDLSKTITDSQQKNFEVLSKSIETIINSMSTLSTTLSKGHWKSFVNGIKSFFTTIFGGNKNKEPQVISQFRTIVNLLFDNIYSTIKNKNIQTVDMMKINWFVSIVNKMINMLDTLSKLTITVQDKLINNLKPLNNKNTISKLISNLVNFYDQLKQQIYPLIQQYKSFYNEVYQQIMGDKSITIPVDAKQNIVNNLTQTLSQMSTNLIGFKYGGYTGSGRTDEIQGVVHKGEYVIPQQLVPKFKNEIDKIEKERLKLLGTKKYVESLLTLLKANLKTTNIIGFEEGGFTDFGLVLTTVPQTQSQININITPDIKISGKGIDTSIIQQIILQLSTMILKILSSISGTISKKQDVIINENFIEKSTTDKLQSVFTNITESILKLLTDNLLTKTIDNILQHITEKQNLDTPIQTLQQNVITIFQNMFTEISSMLTNILQNVYNTIFNGLVGGSIIFVITTSLITKITDIITNNISNVVQRLVVSVVQFVGDNITNSIDTIIKQMSNLPILQQQLDEINKQLTSDKNINKDVKTQLENQKLTLKEHEEQIGSTPKDIKSVVEKVSTLKGTLIITISSMQSIILDFITFSLTKLNEHIFSNNLIKTLTGSVTLINLLPTITNIIIKDIPTLLTSVMSSITSNISNILDTQIKELTNLQFQDLVKIIQDVFGTNETKKETQEEQKPPKQLSEQVIKLKNTTVDLISSTWITVMDIIDSILGTFNFLLNNSVTRGLLNFVGNQQVVLSTIYMGLLTTVVIPKIIKFFTSTIPSILNDAISYVTDVLPKQFKKVLISLKSGKIETKSINIQEIISTIVNTVLDLTGKIIKNNQLDTDKYQTMIMSDNDFLKSIGSIMLFMTPALSFFAMSLISNLMTPITDMLTTIFKPENIQGIVESMTVSDLSKIVTTVVTSVFNIITSVISAQFNMVTNMNIITSDPITMYIMLGLQTVLMVEMIVLMDSIKGHVNTILSSIGSLLSTMFKPEIVEGVILDTSSDKLYDLFQSIVTTTVTMVTSLTTKVFNLLFDDKTSNELINRLNPLNMITNLVTSLGKLFIGGWFVISLTGVFQNILSQIGLLLNKITTDIDVSRFDVNKLDTLINTVVTTTVTVVSNILTMSFSYLTDEKSIVKIPIISDIQKQIVTSFISSVISGLLEPFKSIVTSIVTLFGWMFTEKNINNMVNKMSTTTVDTIITDIINTTLTMLTNLITSATNILTTTLFNISSTGGIFGQLMGLIIDTMIGGFMTSFIKNITTNLSTIFNNITTLINSLMIKLSSDTTLSQHVEENGTTVINNILTEVVNTVFPTMQTIISIALQRYQQSNKGMFERLLNNFLGFLFGSTSGSWDPMSDLINNIIVNIPTLFTQMSTFINNLFTQLSNVDILKTVLSENIDLVKDIIKSIVDNIVSITLKTTLPEIVKMGMEGKIRRKKKDISPIEEFFNIFDNTIGTEDMFMEDIQKPILSNIPTIFGYIQTQFNNILDPKILNYSQILQDSDTGKTIIISLFNAVIDSIFKSFFSMVFDKDNLEKNIELLSVKKKTTQTWFFIPISETIEEINPFVTLTTDLFSKLPILFDKVINGFDSLITQLVSSDTFKNIATDNKTIIEMTKILFSSVLDMILKTVVGTLLTNAIEGKLNVIQKRLVTETVTTTNESGNTVVQTIQKEVSEKINPYIDTVFTPILRRLPQIFELIFGTTDKPGAFDKILNSIDITKIVTNDITLQTEFIKSIFNSTLDMIFKTLLPGLIKAGISRKFRQTTTTTTGWWLWQKTETKTMDSFVENVQKPILEKLPSIFNRISGVFGTILDNLNVNDMFKQDTDLPKTFVKSIFDNTIVFMFNTLDNLLNTESSWSIDRSLLDTINATKTSLLTSFQNMSTAIDTIISSISTTIQSTQLDTIHINNIVSNLVPSISNVFNHMITIIMDSGVLDAQINVNVVNGLWNVLEQFVDELSSHAPDIAGSLFGSLTFNFDYDEMKRKLTMTFTNISEITTEFERQKLELMTEQNTYLSQIQSDVQEIKILLSQIKDNILNNNNNNGRQQVVYQSRDVVNYITSGLR